MFRRADSLAGNRSIDRVIIMSPKRVLGAVYGRKIAKWIVR